MTIKEIEIMHNLINYAIALLRISPNKGINDAVNAAMSCPYVLRMFEEPDDLASAVNETLKRSEIRTKLEKTLVEEVIEYKPYRRCQLVDILIKATRVNTRFHLDGMVDEAIELDYVNNSKVKCSTGLLIEIIKELLCMVEGR